MKPRLDDQPCAMKHKETHIDDVIVSSYATFAHNIMQELDVAACATGGRASVEAKRVLAPPGRENFFKIC